MRIEKVHIDFFTAAPLPGFALRFYSERNATIKSASYRGTIPTPENVRASLIHACVNAHAGISQNPKASANNTCAVLKLWRSNQAHKKTETLADYLKTLQGAGDRRRAGYARKWAAKLARGNYS